MFRLLTEEESRSAKRWQAPSLPTAEQSSAVTATNQISSQHDWQSMTSDDTSNSRDGINSVSSVDAGLDHNDASPSDPENQANDLLHGGKDLDSSENTEIAKGVSAEMLQSSYDEGYSIGYSEGNALASDSNKSELSLVLENLRHHQVLNDERLLEDLINMVKSIAGLVIHRETLSDAAILREWIMEGISQLPTVAEPQVVRLHPLDAASVKLMLDPGIAALLLEDAQLNRGDCRIESGASVVRVGVCDQINRLISSMVESENESELVQNVL